MNLSHLHFYDLPTFQSSGIWFLCITIISAVNWTCLPLLRFLLLIIFLGFDYLFYFSSCSLVFLVGNVSLVASLFVSLQTLTFFLITVLLFSSIDTFSLIRVSITTKYRLLFLCIYSLAHLWSFFSFRFDYKVMNDLFFFPRVNPLVIFVNVRITCTQFLGNFWKY